MYVPLALAQVFSVGVVLAYPLGSRLGLRPHDAQGRAILLDPSWVSLLTALATGVWLLVGPFGGRITRLGRVSCLSTTAGLRLFPRDSLGCSDTENALSVAVLKCDGSRRSAELKRTTRQRELLREVLASAGRPLNPPEIAELAQASIPSLGIATVYRAVKEFVEEGWLVPVAVGGSTRYELAEIGHHHHFHCEDCDRTFDIQGCLGNLAPLVPQGFVITGHELTVSGTCSTCASRASAPKARR